MNSIKSLVNSFDKFYPNSSTFDGSVIPQINDIPEEQEEEELEDDRQTSLLPIQLQSDKSTVDSKDSLSETYTQQMEIEEKGGVDNDEEDEEEDDDDDEEEEEEDSINLIEEKKKQDIDSVKSHQDEQFRSQKQAQQSILFTIIIFILRCVIFLPNNLIIKPILYAYYIITFPIRYTTQQFGSTSYSSKNEDESQISPAIIPEEINDPFVTRANNSQFASTTKPTPESELEPEPEPEPEPEAELPILDECYDKKTEQIKHNNFISNTMKSPTSFSKYMIPPPQRLFPLSRNPEKRRRKKILILDLDETLIHSLSRGSPRSFNPATASKMIEIKLNNISSLYYVYKRPYCDYFLQETSQWFELQIFTASVKEYADPIIDWLEMEILDRKNKRSSNGSATTTTTTTTITTNQTKIFTKRYYRNDCTYRSGVGYIKDLSKFIKDEDLKHVMILDNSPISYALHEENAISIEGWINDQSDKDLLNLLPLLKSLSLAIDVRYILGLKNGEKFIE
ncbi:nuclear envelope morphology protein, putative [Candida dubliniensis CD36]|uniref:Mitochondrial import inner membrane translocase subunit TIM50 n=1 Tax=Candida dubliniensis (strain CD36 / ATCC MYA-646 / CBS 7987 / NCPF 3949 / NRRL Y-17841) TaxID=573826 RepID=B9WFJ2_CANDC|nr:nuclear envelope morphology protein, putative [Candida dubliniensis CD36]CAX42011.1 nuclear envelope morphology protein, putative [Candida dubliniensis CD36]